MGKTANIDDDVHILVIEKQIELRKRGIEMKIGDIINEAIAAGIDAVGEDR